MNGARAWAVSLALHVLVVAALLGLGRLGSERHEVMRWQVSLASPGPAMAALAAPTPKPALPRPRENPAAPRQEPPRPPPPAESVPARPAAQPAQVPTATPPAPVRQVEVPKPGPAAYSAPAAFLPPAVSADAGMPVPEAAPVPSSPPSSADNPGRMAETPPSVPGNAAREGRPVWYAALAERLRALRRYPPMARRLGQEGVVALEILVDADGAPREITLRQSSGFPVLDRAAQDLLRRAANDVRDRLRPGSATRLEIPIAYQLDG